MFDMTNCKNDHVCFNNKTLICKKDKFPRALATPEFLICSWSLQYNMYVFSVGFGTCSCFFFHFLQNYRCIPKTGRLADIFIGIFFDVDLKCLCSPKIGFSADMLTDILIDNCVDMFISISDISLK